MADPGSEFKPVERREAKQFEPPPWERDQFEELARQRAEQEAAEKAAQARLQAEIQAAAEAETAVQQATAAAGVPTQPAPVAAAEPQADAVQAADAAAAGQVVLAPPDAKPVSGPDEAHVTELLAGLAAEEPNANETIWKTSVIIGGVVVVFGLMFVFWGVRALATAARTGFVGAFGGGVLLLFGVGSIAGGVYVMFKNLRQRGVL